MQVAGRGRLDDAGGGHPTPVVQHGLETLLASRPGSRPLRDPINHHQLSCQVGLTRLASAGSGADGPLRYRGIEA